MSELIPRGTSHYKVTDATQSVPKTFESIDYSTGGHYTHWTEKAIQELVKDIEKCLFAEYDFKNGEVPNTPEVRADICKTIDEQLYAKLKGGKQ